MSIVYESRFMGGTFRGFSFGEIEKATNNFDEEMLLGSGGEGKVYKGVLYDDHTNTNITVAVKVFRPDINLLFSTEFKRTKDIISTDLDHPNIVSVVGVCNDVRDRRIVVYEYMDKGSLADCIEDSSLKALFWTWALRLHIAIDVAKALDYLHRGTRDFPYGVIHRDVKPSNILLDENYKAKLSDFGLMKVCPAPHLTQPKGTPGYIAPEYITNDPITTKADVYSYGMVLFELLCGKSPWKCPGKESFYPQDGDNFGDLALQNIDPNIILEISQDCLMVYTDLIGKALRQNPAERPTIHEVVLQLETALKMQQQHDLQRSSSEVPTEPRSEDLSRRCQFESAEVSAAIPANSLIL